VNGATSQQHSVVTSETAEAVWFVGCLALIKATTESTGGALAMVELTHPADFATPPHIHHEEDEAFYILEGAMKGFCGVDEWRATAGDFVWLPRGVPHGYATDGSEKLRTLAITVPTGFERFVRDAGEPAIERTLPPPSELDVPKLVAAAAKHGQEFIDAGGA
jgi:mannose-6-phosphate isomerase-like protein (cupin superfamily)